MLSIKTADTSTLISRIDSYASSVLAPLRYEHSLRVAEMSRDLCLRFGLPPESGFLAGLAHDMCKSGKEQWLLEIASSDNLPLSAIEADKPSLLHGRAAAVLLERDFGVADRSILEAVRHHTFGHPELDALGMIVFVADKIEPGRSGVSPDFRDIILRSDLLGMVRLVLEDNIRYLTLRGKNVSPTTLAMFANLQGRAS